jgi:hypothetical protein
MSRSQKITLGLIAGFGALAAFGGAAFGETQLSISIKDHRFDPAELHAPAHAPITLTVRNLDATPEEFESKQLRVEKVVAGGGTITVKIRALEPGRYPFAGEYHESTAQGALVVE